MNTFYAKNAYIFSSASLKTYFSRFSWYLPDSTVKNNINILTEQDAECVKKIIEYEK